MKRLSLAVALALGLVACPVTDVKPSIATTFGKVELSFSADGSSLKAQAATALPDARITFNANPTCDLGVNVVMGVRYMKCLYTFNNTGAAITNLVMYAYNQSGQSVGGTAIKNMANFTFGALNNAQTAQRFLPTHGSNASGGVITNEADLQLFTTAQATTLEATATPSIINVADTVLEYGFIARTAGNSRTIPANGAGQVTIAYKILDSDITKSNALNPYTFTLNFVLAEESQARVTRSSEETTTTADARATGTDEVMLVGLDSDNSTVGTTVRRGNIKIGIAPTYLLDTSKLSLYVPNFRLGAIKRLDSSFASANPVNATLLVPDQNANINCFFDSAPNSITFDPEGNMWVARPCQSSIIKILKANINANSLIANQTIQVGGGAVGIKYANGLIWVALDPFGGVQNRLRAYNASTGTLVAEFTNGLNFPANIAFDSTGNVWVSNANNNTVVMYAKSRLGNNPDNAAPDRIISNTNIGTTGGQNSLRYPEGLAFDAQGNLWVANNIEGQVGTEAPTIVKYTPAQITASGSPTPNATLILEAASGTSGQPGGLAIDPLDGGLWVNYQIASSVLAGQVRKYDISGGAFTGISTPAALITYSNVTTYPGNGGLAFGNRP
jgi:hypothetical protein